MSAAGEERGRLLARAADGELTPTERTEVERRVREEAGFAEALAEERAAAERANAWAGAWRLPGAGLEEDVLREMGMIPRAPWGRRLVWIGAAAAAALVLAVWLQAEDARPERRAAARASATFVPVGSAGSGAESLGSGAFRVGAGRRRVHAERPTLLETPVGVVDLAPGEYDVEVADGRVTVRVVSGEAGLRGAGGARRTVGPGQTATLTATADPERPDGPESEGGAGAPEPDADARPVAIVGVVRDPEGRGIDGARALVDGVERGVTDAGGHFRIEGAFVPGVRLAVVAAGFAPSDARVLPLDRPAYELSIVLRPRGGALALEIVDGDGEPVAGARVTIGGHHRNVPVRPRSPEGLVLAPAPPFELVAGADGTVLAEGLPPQWNRLSVRAAGFAPHEGWIRVSPEARDRRRFVLHRGAVVFGTVKDASGRGVAGARLGVRQAGSGSVVEGVSAVADASGRYRLANVPARKSEVFAVDGENRTVSTWVRGEPGEKIRWDAVLEEAGAIAGVVRYDDGTPVANARVRCRRALRGTGDAPPVLRTDADGRFSWDRRPDALHEVEVWYPETGGARMVPPARRVRFAPADSPRTIELPRRDAPPEPGHVAGVLVTPDGAAAAGAAVRAWPESQPGWALRAVAGQDGAFRLGPMQPGTYRCELHLDGHPTLLRDGVVVAAGATADLGTVALPRPGRIKGRVVHRGEVWEKGRVVVLSLDGRIYYTMRRGEDERGVYDRSEGLAPGRYLVRGGAPGLEKVVDVRAGETTEVELVLGSGGQARLEFARSDGADLREVRYEVFAESGRAVYSGTLDLGETSATFWAVAGRYRVEATDDRGRKGTAEFTITEAKTAEPVATPRVLLR